MKPTRASKGVALSAGFLLIAAGASACGTGEETREYRAVCVNPQTNERIADRYCEGDRDDSYGYLGFYPAPYYYNSYYDGRYAAVGQRVEGGTRTLPKSTSGVGTRVVKGQVKASGGASGPSAVKGGSKSFSTSKTVSRGGGFGGGSKASG